MSRVSHRSLLRMLVVTISLGSGAAWADSSFEFIAAPSDTSMVYPTDLSNDGSTVVANAVPDGASSGQAFRWTAETGWASLDPLPGFEDFTWVESVDESGEVAVGLSLHFEDADRPHEQRSFLWTLEGGTSDLADLGLPSEFAAWEISDDASTIAGDWHWQPGVWRSETDLVLLETPAIRYGVARDLSANGRVALGDYTTDEALPVRWWFIASDGEIVHEVAHSSPPDASGITVVELSALSGDGRVAFGLGWMSEGANETHCLLRWRIPDGLDCVAELTLPPQFLHLVLSANADGTIVVGSLVNAGVGSAELGFIWDDAKGLRSFSDFLEHEHGLDLAGLEQLRPTSQTSDGRTVTGYARESDGSQSFGVWVATLDCEQFDASIRRCVPSEEPPPMPVCGNGFALAFVVPLVILGSRRRL